MAKPYSMDLRERAMRRLARGETVRQVAAALSVAPSTVVKWSLRLRRTGAVTPGRTGGRRPRAIRGEHEAWLQARAREADFTLRGLVAELAARGLTVVYRTMWSFLHREGLSFKKTVRASEQDRPAIARRRSQWKSYQGRIDAMRLVFIDESWAKTNMAPLRGWGPRGARLRAAVPHGHWKTMTFLAGLRSNGIVAPWVIDGPINGDSFRVYVERVLAPTLSRPPSRAATSLSWTTSGATKVPPSGPRSARRARNSSTSRPTAPT